MFKLLFSIGGAVAGLAIAWAVRPSHWGHRPDMADIFSVPEFQTDFLLFGGAGLFLGLIVGAVIDHFGSRKGKD